LAAKHPFSRENFPLKTESLDFLSALYCNGSDPQKHLLGMATAVFSFQFPNFNSQNLAFYSKRKTFMEECGADRCTLPL
jgi:hypothetical protein